VKQGSDGGALANVLLDSGLQSKYAKWTQTCRKRKTMTGEGGHDCQQGGGRRGTRGCAA